MNTQQMVTRFSLCLLAWCTLATLPTFAQTITHVPLYNFENPLRITFGSSVSGAGDVNGDGFDDLIVGAPGNGSAFNRGHVEVFSGVDGTMLYNFNGDSAVDRFGISVSGAGDVNGDGFDDLIVGAATDDNSGVDSGSVRVFSGVDGSVLYDFDGDSEGDRFGQSVSGAGDVNGDGFDDLIVGALWDDNNGSNSGSARVFSGVDGTVLYNFDGDSEDDRFGGSVSGAGDVNGDGFADLIVGASFDDNNGIDSGSARVFSGVDGSVLYDFDGDSEDDSFGHSVSGAGDVNGDGFADLIVGAVRDDIHDGFNSGGSVRVFSGVDGSVLYNFNRDSSVVFFGQSVSSAGDVNGDGFSDLIVGGLSDNSSNGSAWVFSGVDGSVLYNFLGDSIDDNFGGSVSGAGDTNGDGLADFIVGATQGGASQRGNASVYVSQISPLLGDANLDGVVDFLDISPFIGLLASNTYLKEADCDEDGLLNFLDIAPFIDILADN